jgi:ABC-type amino acid transport substrate-binding protein
MMQNKLGLAALGTALAALILPLLPSPTLIPAVAPVALAPMIDSSHNNDRVFERVTETKKLRCAYLVYPPETIKDVNTGKLSGWVVELTEAVAAELGWTVEWAAEVGFTDMVAGFKTGKYDAVCAGAYETPQRALNALFSAPAVYGATFAFVRADDTRFDADIQTANSQDFSVAFMDGEITQNIAEQNFPNAKKYSLPTLAGIPQLLESVATSKSDMTFTQITPARGYTDANPGKLKLLGTAPVRTHVQSLLMLPVGEHNLKYVLDVALRTLQDNGTVERLVRHYDANLDSYRLIAKPYQTRP